MAISDEEILRIAKLAHIRLDAADVEKYRRDLNGILNYIDTLKTLDACEEPTTHVISTTSRLREDKVEDVLPVEKVLENAPAVEDGQFRVPKVLEGE